MPGQTDRRTDGRTRDRYITLSASDVGIKLIINWGVYSKNNVKQIITSGLFS